MPVKISVIVPVYNVEPYLTVCLDSILRQTLEEFELLLVDDGSTDRSGAICDEYARKDGRIRVIHQENAGQSLARNAALELAGGEYVGFVDADDWIDPEMFHSLYDLAQRQNADLSFCNFVLETSRGPRKVDTNLYAQSVFGRKEIERLFLPYFFGYADEELKNYKEYCPLADYCSYNFVGIFRKALIDRHRIAFLNNRIYFNEDNLFNLHFLARADRVAHLPVYPYHYRLNETSTSQSDDRRYFEKKIQKYVYLKEYIEKNGLPSAFQARLRNKISVETVSLLNYDAGSSSLCFSEKYRRVAQIASHPVIAGALDGFHARDLAFSKAKIYLLLLRLRAYGVIVLLSSVYRRFVGTL